MKTSDTPICLFAFLVEIALDGTFRSLFKLLIAHSYLGNLGISGQFLIELTDIVIHQLLKIRDSNTLLGCNVKIGINQASSLPLSSITIDSLTIGRLFIFCSISSG